MNMNTNNEQRATSNDNIRVRFAPSPTGYLHIGGARTALFNWLFARQNNGKFVLRIEDSDIDRSLLDSEEKIIEDMRWFGLDWDEGPDKPGDFGPYRQTQRLNKYHEYAQKLLNEKKAYLCYCTPEELEDKRKKQLAQGVTPTYDGTCRDISSEQEEKFKKEQRLPAVRFKTPDKIYVVNDLIKGPVEFKGDLMGDFIILKSDKTPSYNFAVVADDADMKITHVIRGDEHLINTPRQIMIYEALNLPLPEFAHIPMILAPDHTKLSKRHGTISVGEFRKKGYLSESLVNYLALLGWSCDGKKEFFSISELINEFSLNRVAKNPAVYDIKKLNWMNSSYLKKLSLDDLTKTAVPFLIKANLVSEPISEEKFNWLKKLLETLKNYLSYTEEIIELSRDYFTDAVNYTREAKSVLSEDNSKKVISCFMEELASASESMNFEKFQEIIKNVSGKTQIKGKALYMPIRSAVTGQIHGAELKDIFELLGRERILKRLKDIS